MPLLSAALEAVLGPPLQLPLPNFGLAPKPTGMKSLSRSSRSAARRRHRRHGSKVEFGFRDALLNRPLEPLAPFHQINITCQTTREIAAEHHLSLTMSGFGSGAEPALGGAAITGQLVTAVVDRAERISNG
jgi:hypothetical protein